MFHVYILKNSKDKIYIGHTIHLEKRLVEHNIDKTLSTRHRGPWILLYTEEYPTRSEAMKREKQLKGGQGRQWIRQRLSNK